MAAIFAKIPANHCRYASRQNCRECEKRCKDDKHPNVIMIFSYPNVLKQG